jgi:hypothetical protein
MDWEQLVAEFRGLGGVAENVRLGTGRFGRGIFVVDPAKPAKLHASENLLVPIDQLEIRAGHMVLTPESTLGRREREFFETYQRHFGWSAGLYEGLWQAQEAWSRLPAPVVEAIKALGALDDPDRRFLAPTAELCFKEYFATRQFTYGGRLHLVPLVELVNHYGRANRYDIDIGSGIGVSGAFADEMLVRYNLGDSWARAVVSGFTEIALLANSLVITVAIGARHVSIGRQLNSMELRDGVMFPRAEWDGDVMRLPFLTLGYTEEHDLPRAVFRALMGPSLTTAQADEAFDSIAHFNRTKFLELLRTLRKFDGPLIDLLEEAAINQLQVLSCCVGARTLNDGSSST